MRRRGLPFFPRIPFTARPQPLPTTPRTHLFRGRHSPFDGRFRSPAEDSAEESRGPAASADHLEAGPGQVVGILSDRGKLGGADGDEGLRAVEQLLVESQGEASGGLVFDPPQTRDDGGYASPQEGGGEALRTLARGERPGMSVAGRQHDEAGMRQAEAEDVARSQSPGVPRSSGQDESALRRIFEILVSVGCEVDQVGTAKRCNDPIGGGLGTAENL